jgi:hypothetical protein
MSREEFIIPNVRKSLIIGCQKSYNNRDFQTRTSDGIKEVYNDMIKLETFLDEELQFSKCKSFKDTPQN